MTDKTTPKKLEANDPASFAAYAARKDEHERLHDLPVPQEYDGYRIYSILGVGNLVLPDLDRYYEGSKKGVVPIHPAACFVLDREQHGPAGQGGGWALVSLVDLYGFSLEHPVEIDFANLQASSPLCRRFQTLLWNITKGTPGQQPQTLTNPNHDPSDPRTGPAQIDVPGRPHGEPLVSRFTKVMAEADARAEKWKEQREAKFVDSSLILPPGARGGKPAIITSAAGASLPELPRK